MSATVAEAARLLAAGELVAIPTETVYGLAADAANPAAVAKIFTLKGRPADHPVIVHVGSAKALDAWAIDIPEAARKLAAAFWPGPLTMILAKAKGVHASVTGGQATVGLRCPSHPVAQALLAEFAKVGSGAFAAPSANRFGHVSPTTVGHVRDEFGPDLPVLDGGPCEVGIESTIVDLSRGTAVLLRPGAITREQIAAIVGEVRERDSEAPRASGTLASHYAPHTPLELVDEHALEPRVRAAVARGERVAVLARGPARASAATSWHSAPESAAAYAHDLYANLRLLDASGAGLILVEAPPRDAAWDAVNDRLARAASEPAFPRGRSS
ncbi:L-threonylcarbamoyladenylate synthase [Usitatibacter palustris]|uniref:Threonylcarbamoyl-AMP synthase n=1 Tax=Usitatibacter palustris TaxID=2732487 RepID=A0A6M4H4H0_9PROT|nr:L-threonylcarbamoyladenylate synthase [Usitatibacter palustris]QJR13394.1 Threonylcarbamoyl-AMP synthase [Usitatibacter palustris]